MATAVAPSNESDVCDGHAEMRAAMELHDVAAAELADVCGVVNAGHGRMVRVMADVLADDVWCGEGILSPRHWLTWKTSLSDASASAVVNLAKRSVELAATVTALCEGRLSLATAGLIARYVPTEFEESVLELAPLLTVRQMRRTVSRYQFDVEKPADPAPAPAPAGDTDPSGAGGDGVGDTEPADRSPDDMTGADFTDGGPGSSSDGADPAADAPRGGPEMSGEPIEERRDVSMGVDDDGNWWLTAHLPPDEGAVVEAAIRARRDDLYRQASAGLDRNAPRPTVTLADGLVSLGEDGLAEGGARLPGTDRYLIHTHLTGAPTGTNNLGLHLGAMLPDHLRRLHTCDGRMRPVVENNGVPVEICRHQRIVPKWLRRLIEHRDGGCTTPGCDRRTGLQVHHTWHWEDGGPTTTDNLLTLCRRHHRLHHTGHLRIWGNADKPRHTPGGVHFADRWGRILTPTGTPTPPPADADLHHHAHHVGLQPAGFEPALGERADYRAITFHRNDPPTGPP